MVSWDDITVEREREKFGSGSSDVWLQPCRWVVGFKMGFFPHLPARSSVFYGELIKVFDTNFLILLYIKNLSAKYNVYYATTG